MSLLLIICKTITFPDDNGFTCDRDLLLVWATGLKSSSTKNDADKVIATSCCMRSDERSRTFSKVLCYIYLNSNLIRKLRTERKIIETKIQFLDH